MIMSGCRSCLCAHAGRRAVAAHAAGSVSVPKLNVEAHDQALLSRGLCAVCGTKLPAILKGIMTCPCCGREWTRESRPDRRGQTAGRCDESANGPDRNGKPGLSREGV